MSQEKKTYSMEDHVGFISKSLKFDIAEALKVIAEELKTLNHNLSKKNVF